IELAEQARGERRPSSSSQSTPSSSRITNLPIQLTHFVGRELEIAEVNRLISDHRLVTLSGSGGVGKTRLAIEVGASFVAATARIAPTPLAVAPSAATASP